MPTSHVTFQLGRILVTSGALAALSQEDLFTALTRHAEGDWGDLDEADRKENDLSLREGYRLLSAYRSKSGSKFWVITEADRSSTTILLPSEY